MNTSTIGDITTSKTYDSRAWSSANRANVTNFGDCARVNLEWDDDVWLYFLCDSKREAMEYCKSIGFNKSQAA